MSRIVPVDKTHLSTMTWGTVTHQAPELLKEHRLTPAGDVYAFGVLLWEMVHPEKKVYGEHSNTPWAIVQHVLDGGRPVFVQQPLPGPYIRLAQRCWAANPKARPTFQEIVQLLSDVPTDLSEDEHVESW